MTALNNLRLTKKQENFAQRYLECGNASEAYRLSYNCIDSKPETINRRAVELLNNGKIAARINQLQQNIAKKHNVTVDSLVGELEDVLREATQDRNWAAVNSSIQLKARITGHLIDKKEHKMDQIVKHELEIKKKAEEDVIAAANNILRQLEHAKVSGQIEDIEPIDAEPMYEES